MTSKTSSLMFFALSACFQQSPGPAAPTQKQLDEASTEQVVKQSADAVVLIFVLDSSGKEKSLGSGFVVSLDGKIVTNYHVIKDAEKALVKLSNGAFFPMESILASDAKRDLALIKVNGKNLPTLPVGDSKAVLVGQRVVAIGSPLGLENTVSDGIVSALRDEDDGVSWIQTTAPVSPGNSGGPLLTMDGKVVGVITWGIRMGQNLNFAATSNEVSALLSRPANVTAVSAKTTTPVAGQTAPVWTSLVSGRDYQVRVDADYIYTEWVLPPALKGTSAFGRGELKKSGELWSGQYRSYVPCVYVDRWTGQQKANWIKTDLPIEITKITATRIEGRAQNYPEGFDCKKAAPKGQAIWQGFTWIPKD